MVEKVDSPLEQAFGLAGRVALVTGGASGIGSGIATLLAQAGAAVVIADQNVDGAHKQAAALCACGHRASAIAIDMAEERSIVAAFTAVMEVSGTPWILINNAGVQDRELLLEGTATEWDRTLAINARGPFILLRESARAMIAAGLGGRIINVSSIGVRHPMIAGLAAYSASKAALLALTQNAAFELAQYDITCNAILPGGVMTPGAMNARGPAGAGPGTRSAPLGICEPRDMAGAVLFFASPIARYVTNQALTIDAGFSLT